MRTKKKSTPTKSKDSGKRKSVNVSTNAGIKSKQKASNGKKKKNGATKAKLNKKARQYYAKGKTPSSNNTAFSTKDRLTSNMIRRTNDSLCSDPETLYCYETYEVVKIKGGAYCLKTVKTNVKSNTTLDIEENYIKKKKKNHTYEVKDNYLLEHVTIFHKTTGLLNFLGNSLVWDGTKNTIVSYSKTDSENNEHTTSIKGNNINFVSDLLSPENDVTKGTPDYGIRRGIAVHEELQHFVTLDTKNFSSLHPNPHPLTLCIISALAQRNYIGLWSEYPVYFKNKVSGENSFVASSIDLVCFDRESKDIVLVEIKTGYSGKKFFFSFSNSDNDKMLNSFKNMKDCPINRANIQLCAYMMFFRSSLKEKCRGTVLHCDSNGIINFYDMNEGFYQKYSALLYKLLKPS